MKKEEHRFPTPIGQKFGRLMVIDDAPWYESPSGKSRARRVLCRCDCGNEIIVKLPSLKNGKTKSCGCLKLDVAYAMRKKYNKFEINQELCIGHCDNGESFMCDKEDYDLIKDYYWKFDNNGYVKASTLRDGYGCHKSSIFLHRLILNCSDDEIVDHINGNKSDNRRSNLRICTHSQNSMNRHTTSHNKCGKVGVTYRAYKNKYEAYIYVNGKNIYLGCYTDKDDAIKARIKAEQKYYGEFAETYSDEII